MANYKQTATTAPTDSLDALKPPNGNSTPAIPAENPTSSRRPSPSIQSLAGDVPDSVVEASVRRSASPTAVASPVPTTAAVSTPLGEKAAQGPSTEASYFPPVQTFYNNEWRVANIHSLEYAVATSIRYASLPALSTLTTTNLGEDRSRRLYSSILVVGSGSLVPGLGYMLEDRVRSLKGGTVSVIPPPRDMDPGVLVWKGASVYSRLKTPEREAFMTKKEWDLYNIRGIPLRLLYVF
jgi:Actin